MIEAVIMLLIYVCVIAVLIYLVLHVLSAVGVPVPAQVVKIVWIIFGLIVLLLIVRLLLGGGGLHLGLT